MPIDDPNDLERIDQEIRINELKEEANDLAGGEMTHWENENCPPGISEAFWRRVVEYEKAPLTSEYEQLTNAGVELPPPDELTDEALTAKLWEIIRILAERRVFINTTNHLSDRELYTHLVTNAFHEVMADLPPDPYSVHQFDLLSGGSDEDTYLYLKHFADAQWRADWLKSFPDYEMPEHVDPPYDRDRHLPKATFGTPDEMV